MSNEKKDQSVKISHPLEFKSNDVDEQQPSMFYLNNDASVSTNTSLNTTLTSTTLLPNIIETNPKQSQEHTERQANQQSGELTSSTDSQLLIESTNTDTATVPKDNIMKFRTKAAAKRIAPIRPDLLENCYTNSTAKSEPVNKVNNFLIDVESVRWYYKIEKEKAETATAGSTGEGKASSSRNSSQNFSIQLNYDINNNSSESNLQNLDDSKNMYLKNVVIEDKKWHMFNRWDSISLETEYRNMIVTRRENSVEPVMVQVLDNLYEVNLFTRKCQPIYSKSTRTINVQRCVWYTDEYEPIQENFSNEIEKKHLELFRSGLLTRKSESAGAAHTDSSSSSSAASVGSNMFDLISKRTSEHDNFEQIPPPTPKLKAHKSESSKKETSESVGCLQFENGTVTWYSENEIYLEKNKSNNIMSIVNGYIRKNRTSNGERIRRGYQEKPKERDADEKPKEITHLVFVVHGIAQKLYENSILKSCEELRKECDKQKKEHFSSFNDQRHIFIPVDWRSSLTLDDGIVESITLKSIQSIRDKLNSSALDIMYYTSPLFRAEIMSSLRSEINRLYNLFCQKNPYFKSKYNKVSFVAHSLGSVIIYDILISNNESQFFNSYGEDSNQEKAVFNQFSSKNSNLFDEYMSCKKRMQEIEKTLINQKANEKISTLDFKTENFFLLGSPLGVFLALRGVRPAGVGSQEHILPKHICKRMFNIFHPSDPIAYRIEPLILKHYTTKSSLSIVKASAFSTRTSYKDMNERRSALNVDLKSSLTKVTDKKKDKDSKSAEMNNFNKEDISISNMPNRSSTIDQVELEEALDYQLQDSSFEIMATLKAHTGYWRSPDVALFLLQHLCKCDKQDKQEV